MIEGILRYINCGQIGSIMDSKKLDDRARVTGKTLLHTVSVMSEFGNLAKDVLEQYGIDQIDEDAEYSYELRSLMHHALSTKYGNVALKGLGFQTAEMGAGLYKEIYTKRDKMEKQFVSQDAELNFTALDELMKDWVRVSDEWTRSVMISSLPFSLTLKTSSSGRYTIRTYHANKSYQRPYFEGMAIYGLNSMFGKYWDLELSYNHAESFIDDGFPVEYFTAKFTKHSRLQSTDLLITKQKSKFREALFKNVLKEVDTLSNQVGKYIPPQIHNAILKGQYDTKIATRRKKLTIFFSDIVNFTSTSEGLQPEDLTKYLNEYFSEMTAIALDCGATIDKYIGDAMMVFFGDPESKGEKEDARACVEMALRMQERMEELQEKWRNEGFADPFQVRMGINTGYCNVGNFGSDQRLTYTIIGGEVNVAQRLEASADADGILMSYETYAHAQDMIRVEQRAAIKMKGISREIKVFSVIDTKINRGRRTSNKTKIATRRELSKIDRLEKDSEKFKHEVRGKLADINEKIEKLLEQKR